MSTPLGLGAVLYAPKVLRIWGMIGEFLEGQGCPVEMVYFSRYERQVDALLAGVIDIAWNSPLAHVDACRRAAGCRPIAMRDTDCDRVSHLVVATQGPATVADLKGQTVGLGAADSPQATLIPLSLLERAGLVPGTDVTVRRFDRLIGLHGDHIGGELEAFEALARGEVAASAMLDLNWEAWVREGKIDPQQFRILATTERFDHCVFTVRETFPPADERRFVEALAAMRYDDPRHREIMDLENLKVWLPGRGTGFGALSAATESQGYFCSTR